MSRYDIRGMQASGMTTQQINDFIKQTEANLSAQDLKSQFNPKNVVAAPVKTPVKQPVKPQVMPPVKPSPVPKPSVSAPYAYPNPKSIPKKGASVPDYLKPGYTGLQGTPAPNAGPRTMGATNPIPQSILGIKKKGGEVKKYAKGGKINLDACGVSTAQKSKSSPKW